MVNNCNFIGRLTKEVDARNITKQDKTTMLVASFDLAIDGAKQEDGSNDTTFIQCKVLNSKQAENVTKYLYKGSLVYVQGALHQYRYVAKDNQQRSGYEIIAKEVTFLDPKPKEEPKEETKAEVAKAGK